MLTAERRYWQAITREGKEPFAECVADLEQQALIKEFERLCACKPIEPKS
jgi:hypothetical protein